MKTSVIEVHDMLSVFSVEEVEKRIGDVPGVASVTVNHAAGSATVRFDETRLEIADIKSDVRQRGYDSAAPAVGGADHAQKGPSAPSSTPAPSVAKPPVLDAGSILAPPTPSKAAAPATADPTNKDNAVPDAVASKADKESKKSK